MSSASQKFILTFISIVGIISSIALYNYQYQSIDLSDFKSYIKSYYPPTTTTTVAASLHSNSITSSASHAPLISAMSKSTAFKFIPRISSTRGYADHGWLRTYHTFSFANYYSPADMSFGPLRVINEDNIARAKGFDTHHHREFEIFTYITKGEIVHKDSLGNVEVLKRGDVQYTSAGTGISHSEYAGNKSDASILQIWVTPNERNLKPTYYTRHHPEDSKRGLLKKIIAPREVFGDKLADVPKQDGKEELIPIPADMDFFASMLKNGDSVNHVFGKKAGAEDVDGKRKRLGLVHLVMSSGIRKKSDNAPEQGAKLKVIAEDGTEAVLTEGDGLKIEAREGSQLTFESVGEREAEFVFFDMAEK